MPPSAENCRAKAFECAELAAKTRDTFSKLLLEQTSERWCVLAEGAEKYAVNGSAKDLTSPGNSVSLGTSCRC
jgi:hypothetical protein